MMLLIVLPACQIAIRIGLSSRVYHEDVTSQSQPRILFDRKSNKHTQSDSREERSFAETRYKANHAEAYATVFNRQHIFLSSTPRCSLTMSPQAYRSCRCSNQSSCRGEGDLVGPWPTTDFQAIDQ